jgi:hypothetical protein
VIPGFGRILILIGVVLIAVGAIFEFAPWLRLGRLPGDISVGNGNVRFYFPIVTSLLLSVVLSLLLWLFSGWRR